MRCDGLGNASTILLAADGLVFDVSTARPQDGFLRSNVHSMAFAFLIPHVPATGFRIVKFVCYLSYRSLLTISWDHLCKLFWVCNFDVHAKKWHTCCVDVRLHAWYDPMWHSILWQHSESQSVAWLKGSTWRSRAKTKNIATATDELQNDIDIMKICTKMVYIYEILWNELKWHNMSQYDLWHNVQLCTNMTPWFYIAGTFMVLVANMQAWLGEMPPVSWERTLWRRPMKRRMGHQSVSLVVYISLVRNTCLHNTTCKSSYYTKHQTYHYILQ